jgi:CDP-glycerol glycerophosphotransferase
MSHAAVPSGGDGHAQRGLRHALRILAHHVAVEPVYLASHLAPRNRRTWLFGSKWGFRGNPRYLAEYLQHAGLGIQPVWVARSRSEAQAARAAGLRVVNLRDRAGLLAQLRAGVVILSFSFADVTTVALGGSYVVHLFHGIPLKRIGLDVDPTRSVGGPPALRGLVARLMQRRVGRTRGRADMIVAPGELAKARFVTAFGVPAARVRVLGTPRFDVLQGGAAYERVAGGDLRAALGLKATDYICLWLPTWRDKPDAAWVPPLDARQVEDALAGTNIVLIIKPHPLSDHAAFEAWLPKHPQVRLLREDEADVNALLRISDALISDYSSAILDYAILDRPIHFLTPDQDEYELADRGLYEPLSSIAGGRQHEAWSSLLGAVVAAARGQDDEPLATARRIRQRSQNSDAPGSCARIVAAIAHEIGLEDVAIAAAQDADRSALAPTDGKGPQPVGPESSS